MSLSRRRLLTGLPVSSLAIGCRRDAPSTRGEVVAQFVGQNPERAHRLRDGTLPASGPGETLRTKVLIVGGGASGMAAAWRLQRAKMSDFTVVELEDALGGTARGGDNPRSAYPMGAHYLPAPHASNTGLWTLLSDLGFVVGQTEQGPELDPRIICRAPVERHKEGSMWGTGLYPARGQTADEAAQWERWRDHLRELDGRLGDDGGGCSTCPSTRARGSCATWTASRPRPTSTSWA